MQERSEKAIVGGIVRLLKRRNCWHVKFHGDRMDRRGVPDLLICYRGYFVAMEVKRPGAVREVTKLQSLELDKISKAGGFAWVVTSEEQAEELLNDIDMSIEDSGWHREAA